jgi:hypothetical protein
MVWGSILHAHEYWRLNGGVAHMASTLEDAETFILNQRPNSAQEAACILDVICAYDGDVRGDGLDLAALRRIHTFLSMPDQRAA